MRKRFLESLASLARTRSKCIANKQTNIHPYLYRLFDVVQLSSYTGDEEQYSFIHSTLKNEINCDTTNNVILQWFSAVVSQY